MTNPGVVGMTLLNRLLWIEHSIGEAGHKEILTHMVQSGSQLAKDPQAIEMEAVYHLAENDLFLDAVFGCLGESVFDRMGREVPQSLALAGRLPRYDTPIRILALNLEGYWRAHFTAGNLRTLSNETGHLEIELSDFPGSELACRHLGNYFAGVAIATEATSHEIEHPACIHSGDPSCRWDVSYQY